MGGVEEVKAAGSPGQVLGLPAAGATPCHSMPLSALLLASKPDPPPSGTTSSTPSVAADFAAPVRGARSLHGFASSSACDFFAAETLMPASVIVLCAHLCAADADRPGGAVIRWSLSG